MNINLSQENNKQPTSYLSIGIDFGGVLSAHDSRSDKETGNHNLEINVPDAMNSLLTLKNNGHKLYLISFCGKKRAAETRESIVKNAPGVFETLYFVKSKDYKKNICKYLGLDVFIDDTLPILVDVAKNINNIHLIHFTGDEGFEPQGDTRLKNIVECSSWKDVVELCENIKPLGNAKETENNLSKMLYI